MNRYLTAGALALAVPLAGCGGAADLLLAAADVATTVAVHDRIFERNRKPDRTSKVDPGGSRQGQWPYASNSFFHAYYDCRDGRSCGIVANDPDVPSRRNLSEAGAHGATSIFHGRVRDGVGQRELTEYLRRDAAQVDNDRGLLRWGRTPPTVHVVEGASRAMIEETKKAILLINGALPADWQLRVSTSPITEEQEAAGIVGGITVNFSPRYRWPSSARRTDADGWAFWRHDGGGQITQAAVLVDSNLGSTTRLGILTHELIHTLGRQHADPDRFSASIMHAYVHGAPDFVLYPLDREALHAVYSRMSSGTQPSDIATDLGPWADVSTHVIGRIGESIDQEGVVVFGAAVLNGHVRSYAAGTDLPVVGLRNNPALRGSATWTGRLLGLTPDARVVAGDADLTVRLATLTGDIDFTNLEAWAAGAPPGAIGTGGRWGDGDLVYTITVTGNNFVQTGGDDGAVTGAFFGPKHESMGGTLKRTDLSAGFGGTR